ncbi:MAG TPA: family 43 glycosylhydrolase, partial [Opitutaceae bacterium]|nr:family 43 glycosylhydrolase [Opitutaceae bacterium]
MAFDWFEYSGRDVIFSRPAPAHGYRHPILAGSHPDPSICRVGGDHYLVNSSFAYFPGIPIFHRRDLVNWTQLGHVVTQPGQLNYDGIGVSRGILAPTRRYHAGTFFLVCSMVDAGGNFLMTASDPAGPWSDPVWLGFDGLDPSLFFDDDGRSYIVNNGPPPDNRPLYDGHRAIWLQEFEIAHQKFIGPRAIVVNGGTDIARQPVWIEGPRLFKTGGWYYLICAEGGTAE